MARIHQALRHYQERGIPAEIIKSETPCCKKATLFLVLTDVPREEYKRVCHGCGKRWEVLRTHLRTLKVGRIDKLEWTPIP